MYDIPLTQEELDALSRLCLNKGHEDDAPIIRRILEKPDHAVATPGTEEEEDESDGC